MKKEINIKDIYLLHVVDCIFYIPMTIEDGYCPYNPNTGVISRNDYYTLTVKKKEGVYTSIDNLRVYRERETFRIGCISSINKILSLEEALKDEELSSKVKNILGKYAIDQDKKLLKKVKRNMRGVN